MRGCDSYPIGPVLRYLLEESLILYHFSRASYLKGESSYLIASPVAIVDGWIQCLTPMTGTLIRVPCSHCGSDPVPFSSMLSYGVEQSFIFRLCPRALHHAFRERIPPSSAAILVCPSWYVFCQFAPQQRLRLVHSCSKSAGVLLAMLHRTQASAQHLAASYLSSRPVAEARLPLGSIYGVRGPY